MKTKGGFMATKSEKIESKIANLKEELKQAKKQEKLEKKKQGQYDAFCKNFTSYMINKFSKQQLIDLRNEINNKLTKGEIAKVVGNRMLINIDANIKTKN